MSLKMAVTTNHVITGVKSCILCSKDIKYIASITGERYSEESERLYKSMVAATQVVVLKKSFANNNKLHIIDVEITLACPQCNANNRFSHFLTIENSDKK